MKTEFPEKWKYLDKKLAYPYENFNSIDDRRNPVKNIKKKDLFSKLENKYPSDEKMKRKK